MGCLKRKRKEILQGMRMKTQPNIHQPSSPCTPINIPPHVTPTYHPPPVTQHPPMSSSHGPHHSQALKCLGEVGVERREGHGVYSLEVARGVSIVALEVVVDEGEGNVHECDPGHAVDGDDDGACRRKR